MPLETIAPSTSPGAGRTLDLLWPSPVAGIFNTGASATNNVTARAGSGAQSFAAASTGTLNAGASVSMQKKAGIMAARYATGATANAGVWTSLSMQPTPIVEPLAVSATGDAWRCWSARFLVAWDNPAAAVGTDYGLLLMAYNQTQFAGTTNPGIYLGMTNANTLTLQARRLNGGALTVNQAIANPPDLTQWNMVEMRILGADKGTPAVLKILINGAVMTSLNFGATAGLLPDPDAHGSGFAGYTWLWAAFSPGVNLNLYMARVQIIAAPTEAALG